MENLLTIEQTAEILGVCVKTVRRLIHKLQLPALKVGRQWRIDSSALQRYIRSHVSFTEYSKLPMLYFKPDVLDEYRQDAGSIKPKYYLQETEFHGRLGIRADLYHKRQVDATKWMGKKATARKKPKPDSFSELKFWKVTLRFGTEVIAVDSNAFTKISQTEQNKWLPYRVINPQF
ncbi:MAG: helix-turn-helix domain-containing protein [Planctomycetota bacterium]